MNHIKKLIANENAYNTLAAYISGGRLPHAILIEGSSGSGRSTFARQIAQGALCSGEINLRPCGVCRDCTKVHSSIHPDFITYEGSGGSRSFHIDTVRELRSQAFVKPNEAEAKILLLEDVQNMTVQAQNALLKIIEQPPNGVYFILTCENRAALLVTVLSRVTVIELAVPSVEQCEEHILEISPDADKQQVSHVAEIAGGNIGKALNLMENSDDIGKRQVASDILYNMCVGSEHDALVALSAYERDRQGMAVLLQQMSGILSGQMVKAGMKTADDKDKISLITNRIDSLRLMKILDIIEDTAHALSQNVSGLLIVTSLCSRIRSVL